MASLFKRRRFKFEVCFKLCDLKDCPLVSAVIFAKLRLLSGGHFNQESQRLHIVDHHINWDEMLKFICRIASNQSTGVLEPCLFRVSIRKESKGGKSYQKLGYVDINLSEFAGSGPQGLMKSYILYGYHGKREDNSRLRVNITMTLLSSDPCFKVPLSIPLQPDDPNYLVGGLPEDSYAISSSALQASIAGTVGGEDTVNMSGFAAITLIETKAPDDSNRSSKSSTPDHEHASGSSDTSSGCGSLPPTRASGSDSGHGHSRNASSASQQSIGLSPLALGLTHSRHSSSESGQRKVSDCTTTAATVGNSSVSVTPKPSDARKRLSQESLGNRMDKTRTDPGELVEHIIQGHLSSLSEEHNDTTYLHLSHFS